MEQSQTKALAALQPFVHLATTTKNPSPRFVAELIKSAVSAPGTYIFTELLQTEACQSLRGTDSQSWLTLLEIFSWGTYEEYKATPNLPPLDDSQTFKLRQLSLLTLASPFAPTSDTKTSTLTYPSLLQSLSLSDPASLESLVTQSIYTGLLTARLSPTSNPPVVNVTSVAPLRDLRPQSLPALLQILQTWESRCTSMISELEGQITAIRSDAAQRSVTERKRQDTVDAAVLSTKPAIDPEAERKAAGGLRPARGGQRLPSKRDIEQHMEGEDEDYSDEMDVDEGIGEGISTGGGSARGGYGLGAAARGAKRNRGRGSK
ncbi:hypothetical protein LTR10_021911 [Elasticomyces elasticus]|uniref:PCI domain-containing protein n=1 Tax=Exophiala sideris TaxID=1016849 RepID=A0ABR0IWP0_9EURO|nr:hypothetical protein LTR10_021911 [Elasticomyces elasticus]KAK5021857.1 hypothetical protein LTS07_010598 [Exophiala sideris]KAK5025922.1 hypothetical protein LTR13_010235 [Exophiala sideris]KAK5050287.1 hypothetical protein LTR69_010622 [Exophiala sideris]KAK5177108.1 hypothetical protein LTR44_010392 [Eurotiomycetes sp. CCFEE 6388]